MQDLSQPDGGVNSRADRKRDHSLRPEWLTKHDPLPLPATTTERERLESLARRMIAANAIRRYREDKEDGRVSYSRRRAWYAEHPSRFYWPKWFSYKYILTGVAQMDAAGLLIHDQKKSGNRHWQSWFRASAKLMGGDDIKLQYVPKHKIILRDEEKNDIAYNDKARIVIRMIRDIDAVNAYLARQSIMLDNALLKEGDALFVDLHCISGALRISTRRIFHDGSFSLGGRWYNDLQNIPRAARNRLRLNGQPVAIHDYSAFYPGLLYAMVGAECSGDPYAIQDWPRHISKPTLNILINAKSQTAAVRATAKKLKELGDNTSQKDRHNKARAIIGALKTRNATIARYFNSDIGKRLMHYEAFVLHDNMRDLMKAGIPFLPLHDALLVPVAAEPRLIQIMATNLAILRVSLKMQFQAVKSASSTPLNLDSVSPAIPVS
jgi:hypothetical protein